MELCCALLTRRYDEPFGDLEFRILVVTDLAYSQLVAHLRDVMPKSGQLLIEEISPDAITETPHLVVYQATCDEAVEAVFSLNLPKAEVFSAFIAPAKPSTASYLDRVDSVVVATMPDAWLLPIWIVVKDRQLIGADIIDVRTIWGGRIGFAFEAPGNSAFISALREQMGDRWRPGEFRTVDIRFRDWMPPRVLEAIDEGSQDVNRELGSPDMVVLGSAGGEGAPAPRVVIVAFE